MSNPAIIRTWTEGEKNAVSQEQLRRDKKGISKRYLPTAILIGLTLMTGVPTTAAPINPLPPPKPDLVASPKSIGADGTVIFAVQNQGRSYAPASITQVTYDGGNLITGTRSTFVVQVATPGLSAGQTVTLSVRPAPTFRYCAAAFTIADVSGVVVESSEMNNRSGWIYGGSSGDCRICLC